MVALMDVPSLGRAIKKYFSSEKSYKLIDAYPGTREGTWTAGGCWAAAAALHSLLPGSELMAVVSRKGRGVQSHAVVKFKGWYLDADGASSHDALLRRWRDLEFVESPVLRPLQPEKDMACPTGLVRDLQVALRPIISAFF